MTDFAAAREAMVDCQVRPADVTRYAIIEAMLWAPRENFVPRHKRPVAYAGTEIDLGEGRVMLEPRVLAKMLETAAILPGDLVLEIGPATGYSTALIARMAEAVVAVEPDETFAKQAQELLAGLEVHNAVVSQGDPAKGDADHAPFDVIFFNGAVETLPDGLTDQLRDGGRLVAIFADNGVSQCRLLVRSGNAVSERYMFDATGAILPGFERPPAFVF
ncbi:protein-L-isoaspartate O-methyltransferase [Paralimibaculum aggregatum]|uniref:Protein-L-isoaspartate O-methyltransferase n=1 Tax=Paralimibaculum aggregatum TaxID=3036245 RepID=A0ABQ6LK29_9RHOB|nr:protein-L-isoaspartate O-methyltransferase [Limibaculum sp. NKW23]GMG83610.1 protein-L-isoaspartate O-methyltransferase [Limibaculum sp. NKW23]